MEGDKMSNNYIPGQGCYGQRYLKLEGKPVDDDKATYNFDLHIYVLNKDYFKDRTGIDLVDEFGSEAKANVELEQICFRMTDLIYNSGQDSRKSRKLKEYIIAKSSKHFRDDYINALVFFVRAAVTTDIDRIGDEVDLSKFNNYIPTATRSILTNLRLIDNGYYNQSVDPLDYRVGY
jgi:hypothetical protein